MNEFEVAKSIFTPTRPGADGMSTVLRFGTVKQANSDNTAVVTLDDGQDVTLRSQTPLYDGSRVSAIVQGGKYVLSSGSGISTAIQKVEQKTQDELTSFGDTFQKKLDQLQADISDGGITTWYDNGVPTDSNEPASGWSADEKRQHTGDLYFDRNTKKTYRWNGSGWDEITDPDIQKAMDNASNAQDTADDKRRIFYNTPCPPYEVGDMWANGSQIMVCNQDRRSGSFSSSDWIYATSWSRNIAMTTLVDTFTVSQERIYARKTFMGSGSGTNLTPKIDTSWWWVFTPGYNQTLPHSAKPPVYAYGSLVLRDVSIHRDFFNLLASNYEFSCDWPVGLGSVTDDNLPIVIGSVNNDDLGAWYVSWDRSASEIGPIVAVAPDNSPGFTDYNMRIDMFVCNRRIIS